MWLGNDNCSDIVIMMIAGKYSRTFNVISSLFNTGRVSETINGNMKSINGDPQIWFIPNTGLLYRDKDCPELISQFDMLVRF